MNIGEWLIGTMVQLRGAGVDSPRRDALVLLEDVLRKDRAWVTAHPEYEIRKNDLETVNKLVQQRLKRIPLAYIRGKAWFYGRFFVVDEHTLIPRPESENFIEQIKVLRPAKVIDFGTGSGALAVTTALELPDAEVLATDISSDALAVARKNAQNHGTDITFLSGSLLEPLTDTDLTGAAVLANLPYVPDGMVTSPEITMEPKLALFAGDDGLQYYRTFWQQIANTDTKPTYVLTEALESQHDQLITMAGSTGYQLITTDVLIQVFSATGLKNQA